jgi:hypothetical protein
MAKKTKVADTSANAYKSLIASGQMSKEVQMVFDAVSVNQPVTSRMLIKLTGLERCNITSPLNKLVNENTIIVVYKKTCTISGFTAGYYATTEWEVTNHHLIAGI